MFTSHHQQRRALVVPTSRMLITLTFLLFLSNSASSASGGTTNPTTASKTDSIATDGATEPSVLCSNLSLTQNCSEGNATSSCQTTQNGTLNCSSDLGSACQNPSLSEGCSENKEITTPCPVINGTQNCTVDEPDKTTKKPFDWAKWLKILSKMGGVITVSGLKKYQEIQWWVRNVAVPAVSIFGVIGNVLSIYVLRKHGFKKSSNILLVSLAVADSFFIIGINEIPYQRFYIAQRPYGFYSSTAGIYFLFIWYMITDILYDVGQYTSLTVPVCITIERLIAIFLPLKFSIIVTRTRTIVVVVAVYLLWAARAIYLHAYTTLELRFIPSKNTTIGVMTTIDTYVAHTQIRKTVDDIGNELSGSVSVAIVLVGSIIIGVKVTMASRMREKLTSANKKNNSTTKTTKVLLAVCVLYTIVAGYSWLLPYMPGYSIYFPSVNSLIMFQFERLFFCINSSANFLIYITMNPKFRQTLRKSLCPCWKDAKGVSSSYVSKTESTDVASTKG